MVKKQTTNYIDLINNLKRAGRNNKQEVSNILYLYDIANIKVLGRSVLEDIFTIDKDELNYINLIYDLKNAGRNNKQELFNILNRYDIANIKVLDCKALEYLFTVGEKELNYINLISDLKKVGRNNKQELIKLLYHNDIANINVLERRVLKYLFSIDEEEIRTKLFDVIAQVNNLPIMSECYYIINSGVNREQYIENQYKNLGRTNAKKYERCIKIINNSPFLQEKIKIVRSKFNYMDCSLLESVRIIGTGMRKRALAHRF